MSKTGNTEFDATAEAESAEKSSRKTIATAVDAETFARFENVAWSRKHRTNSPALREAVDEYIAKYADA